MATPIDLQNPPYGHPRTKRREACFVSLREGLYHQLPEVSCVTKFTYSKHRIHCQLVPKTCCEIASRFPKLISIAWSLEDGSRDHGFRVRLRNDFATGISKLPDSVRHLRLDYYHYDALCLKSDETPRRLYPETVLDPLSVALRGLSMQLETIWLDMVIGSELLWEPGFDRDQKVHWPRLREMSLCQLHPTPQGKQLLHKDPENPVWKEWPLTGVRATPIPALENPFHLALAHAAGRMSKLRRLSASWGWFHGVQLEYTTQLGGPGGRGSHGAEFFYQGTPLLDLPHELQEAWLQTARVHLRDGAELRFRIEDNVRFQYESSGHGRWTKPKVVEWTRAV